MEQRISLITLGVADLARARAFYEALGWRTNAEPDDDVVFFQAGGMILALWDRARLAEDSGVEDSPGFGGVTLAHNVRSPSEVDARKRLGPGPRSRERQARLFGAATPGCSPIQTAIRGRSLTTRAGPSAKTGW